MILTAQRAFVGITFLALLSGPALAQSLVSEPAPTASSDAATATTPTFDLADVHVSAKTTTPYFTGGRLHGDRYLLHNAADFLLNHRLANARRPQCATHKAAGQRQRSLKQRRNRVREHRPQLARRTGQHN